VSITGGMPRILMWASPKLGSEFYVSHLFTANQTKYCAKAYNAYRSSNPDGLIRKGFFKELQALRAEGINQRNSCV
jgi:hypothetical protein